MDFNQSEFEKNLLRKAGGDSDGTPGEKKIDIESIHIKDADDVPINTYEGETPRDRAAKLAMWEAQKGKKPGKTTGKAADKEKKKRRVPKGVIYISCVLAVSLLLTLVAWLAIRDCFAFHNKVSEDIPIVVEDGEGLSAITTKLSDADIIDFPLAFRMYYSLIKKNTQVQYGTHYFKKGDDYDTILRKLAQATESRETVEFLITEGKTQADVIRIIANAGYASTGDLTEAINFADYEEFKFLENLPDRAARLEGYLFPAKYEIYAGESATSIIIRMLKKFDSVFDDVMYDRAKELGMTVDEVITLASIIQAEAGSEDEMPNISSVFHNRLNNPSYGYLQSCSTVQYTMSERKAVLTRDDISVDNKYNTYKYPGLPVGPICNPGLAAIEAALYPAETDYYYFVSDGQGHNVFSRTYAEHTKAKNAYIQDGKFINGTDVAD
ncbi:MAG: endolytic transglycosylase MltG [Clostridia bacterium]|nr:endolytic transglycosylase MltG [Clostridia bacterium]MBR5768488.1 endolytic transglycosylase MltG [Clostridia bacterium]